MKEIVKTRFWTLKKIQLMGLLFLIESILLPFQAMFLSRILDSMGVSAHRKDKHTYFSPTMGATKYPVFDSIQEVAQVIAVILFAISLSCILITFTFLWISSIRRNNPNRITLWPSIVLASVVTLAIILIMSVIVFNFHFEYDGFLYELSESMDWNAIPRIEINSENPRCHDILYNPCK